MRLPRSVVRPLRLLSTSTPAFPRMPVVGSIPWMLRLKDHNGNIVDLANDPRAMWPAAKLKYGPIYEMVIPGFTDTGELVIVTDPNDMFLALKAEGPVPTGALAYQWPTREYMEKSDSKVVEFFGTGEDWSRYRKAMQRDLLTPSTAKGYIPAINNAAELALPGAPLCASDFATYTSRATFDMFSSVLLGQLTQVADPTTPCDPRNMKFCVDVLRGTEALSPVEIIGHKLGIPSPLRSKLKNHFSPAFLRAGEITREVLARREKGELTELEKHCYLVRSFDSPHDDVSTEELIELLNITLLASVDTTSSMVNWVIANLACNQEVQDQLRQEVTEAMAGGGFTDQLASKSSLPFLSQVLRETHRLTPSLAVSIMKQVQRDVQLCGYDIPAGKVVSLDAFSIQNDPAYVDKPEAFVPSRWSAEEVSKRKGTPKEIIDHRLLADPFSAVVDHTRQGARMCPGSRVANMEVRCLLSHLVRSYRFEWQGAGPISAADIPYQQGSTIQPNPLPPLKITPV